MSTVYHKRSRVAPNLSVKELLINPPNHPVSFYDMITPDNASYILATANFSKQRRIKPKQVKSLADAMLKGRFRAVNPVTFAIDESLKVVNVNGQHTLRAIIESKQTVELLINFTPESANDIYTVIDVQAKRTPADMLNAISDWDVDLSPQDINKFGSACRILATCAINRPETDVYIIKETGDKYLDSYLIYKDWISSSGADKSMKQKLLGRSPVAVACAMIKHLPSKKLDSAELFWFRVVTGEGIKTKSPEKLLHDKYVKGRKTWMGMGLLELKEILMYWKAYSTTRKRLNDDYLKATWQTSPNLYGTNINFTDK